MLKINFSGDSRLTQLGPTTTELGFFPRRRNNVARATTITTTTIAPKYNGFFSKKLRTDPEPLEFVPDEVEVVVVDTVELVLDVVVAVAVDATKVALMLPGPLTVADVEDAEAEAIVMEGVDEIHELNAKPEFGDAEIAIVELAFSQTEPLGFVVP
jgi:hypothetical protein